MQEVVDFWVDRGVDGFRVDTIDFISKNMEAGANSFGPHLHDYIRELFGRKKTAQLFTVGESFTKDISEMARHCAADRGELSTLIMFDHLESGRVDKFTPLSAGTDPSQGMKTLRDHLIRWQRETAAHDLLYTIYSDSHDQPPMISRVADDGARRYESATCLAMMLYLLKGVPIIYQGQEIGVTSARYENIGDFDDIETLNAYHEFCRSMPEAEALAKINFGSRDNARRPMAWTSGENGDFIEKTSEKRTASDTEAADEKICPWISLHPRYQEINVETDLAAAGSEDEASQGRSIYRFYQSLLKLRLGQKAFLDGEFHVLSHPEDVCFVYTRTLTDVLRDDEEDPSTFSETWVVICNFAQVQEITLPFRCEAPVLANLGRTEAAGTYQPYECAAARVIV